MSRIYFPSLAELFDRLNIAIQKTLFAETEEMRLEFVKERDDIIHDINVFISEGIVITGEMIHAAMLLQLINITIWENENEERKSIGRLEDAKDIDWEAEYKRLRKTHQLNADRAFAKKKVSQLSNGRIDHKLNYIGGLWNYKF